MALTNSIARAKSQSENEIRKECLIYDYDGLLLTEPPNILHKLKIPWTCKQ